MLLHAVFASSRFERVVVRADDTDVLVMLLYFHAKGLLVDKTYLEHTSYGDKERFLNIHTVVQKWGYELCLSLPAFHALTGCDTTSSFHRIGKISAFKCLLKHLKDVPHLKHLGCQPVSDNCYRDVENFVASLYSGKFENEKSLNRIRYMQAMTTDKPAASLPPTSMLSASM